MWSARPPISKYFQVRLVDHQGVSVLFQEEADFRGGGGVTEEIDVYANFIEVEKSDVPRERHISSQLPAKSGRFRTSTKVLSRPVTDISIPERSPFITSNYSSLFRTRDCGNLNPLNRWARKAMRGMGDGLPCPPGRS
jgi:hypothetical protein